MSAWQVKLPRFEGPLDLLLFLVARQEYDIADLPMAEITESYLAVMDSIGVENLEDAGEYLVMAATLIAIKAKMMLPRPPAEAEEEIEDPRRELAQRLLLYQKAKEEAERLAEREANMLQRWEMGRPPVLPEAEPAPEELLVPISLYDLARAIEDILRRREERVYHQVHLDRISLDERMHWILDLLKQFERFGMLRHLRTEAERIIWVVTFLAILELTKRQQIHLEQNELFSEIFISQAVVLEPELEAA
jgi:segregation and condensation protein A